MILINEKRLNEINNWEQDKIYVVTDFDKTITDGNSISSWGILSKHEFDDNYKIERENLYNTYHPIEIDSNISMKEKEKLMTEWWKKHIELFFKYEISEQIVKDAIKDKNVLKFRDGAKELLKRLNEKNIPVIIISAGIGNFIVDFLKLHNCYYDNINVVSNFLEFKDGKIYKMSDTIIHTFNKDIAHLSDEIKNIIIEKSHPIVMGDNIGDITMLGALDDSNAFTIGFLEEKIEENLENYKQNFDMVCTNCTSFEEIKEKVEVFS